MGEHTLQAWNSYMAKKGSGPITMSQLIPSSLLNSEIPRPPLLDEENCHGRYWGNDVVVAASDEDDESDGEL